MDRKKDAIGHSLAFVTIIIWGMTFISTKILLQHTSPVEILFLRFVIGFIALCIIFPVRIKVVNRMHEWYFAAAGLCGVTLYFLLENIALTYTLASNVGVIVAIVPFFTALLARFFLVGERLSKKFFVGFFVAFAGIFLISFNGNFNLSLNPAGDLLAIAASIVWAVYSVLTKKISQFQYNTIQATRKIFFFGLLFLLPVLMIYRFNPKWEQLAQPISLLHLLFLGLGASALCFVTWNSAVKTLGAVKTSVYIYLVPVVTIIASALILQERITTMAVFGTLLTLAGLFISESRFSKKSM